MSKESVLDQFSLFSLGGEGIGGWLTQETDDKVFKRLDSINEDPLSKSQINQLLVFGHQAPVSDDFFTYYWLDVPSAHPYPVDQIIGFKDYYCQGTDKISSLEHLWWGMYRLFVDALLYFGNVRTAYRTLRTLSRSKLDSFFEARRFDTHAIKRRGEMLPLEDINRDDRHLVSEVVCKSFGEQPESESEIRQALREAYDKHRTVSSSPITFRSLLTDELPNGLSELQPGLELAMGDVFDDSISSEEDFEAKFGDATEKYIKAREAAVNNTYYYLSMASDLDVYVATSMRRRQDFRDMAVFCDEVFRNARLDELNLRYFDPTLSAAYGHEDKGLIECLMVKCAKVLVYCAGQGDSYGKDAEAAMALSLGKPVIFYCDEEARQRFYRDVHPLSRLIEFDTGVAVGAIVTADRNQVVELLSRLFENRMQYRLELHPSRREYLRLKEELTGSVVRLQTDSRLLTETFWNHYRNPL